MRIAQGRSCFAVGNLHSPSGLTPNQTGVAKAANHLEIKLKRKVAEAQGYYAQGAGTLYYYDLLALFAITWVVIVGGTASILIESVAEQCPFTYRE